MMPRNKNKGPSDFNDLHQLQGLEVVRCQLTAALQAFQAGASNDSVLPEVDAPVPSPAPPSNLAAERDLKYYLDRYAITDPDAKIWDRTACKCVKPIQLKRFMGSKLYGEWESHPDRACIAQDGIDAVEQAAKLRGDEGLSEALNRYVYLNPSSEAWDIHKKLLVPLKDLRNAIAKHFDDWLRHDKRLEIEKEKLVFDPTETVSPDEGYINRFKGFVFEPSEVAEPYKCLHILKMFDQLCNGDKAVLSWLFDWIAYPLQYPGSKMATSVLVHSPVQGAGKSWAFDKIIGGLYGDYSQVFTQNTLEQHYNDYISGCLFGTFEEVFSRNHKYQISGFLKQLISGETFWVEKKFVSGWKEGNYMNCVFLSNEVQPFPVDVYDRRFCVIWPESKLDPELAKSIEFEIANGGLQALYDFFMMRDLDGFGKHSKPPSNDAKKQIIDFGLAGWQVFANEWLSGEQEFPQCPILVGDLFRLYKRWCNERKDQPLSQHKFTHLIRNLTGIRLRSDVHYAGSHKKGRFVIPDAAKRPENKNQNEWFGECVVEIRKILDRYEEG